MANHKISNFVKPIWEVTRASTRCGIDLKKLSKGVPRVSPAGIWQWYLGNSNWLIDEWLHSINFQWRKSVSTRGTGRSKNSRCLLCFKAGTIWTMSLTAMYLMSLDKYDDQKSILNDIAYYNTLKRVCVYYYNQN